MAKPSLEHSSLSLNLSLHSYDLLSEHLGKATALVRVALCEHFALQEYSIIHDYLWVLEDLMLRIHDIVEELWKEVAGRKDVEAS